MTAEARRNKGTVYLVGAGPGRADLITLRGAELLRQADCVIVDKLVCPELLQMVRPDAEVVHVPKRIGPGSVSQGQINRLLVEKALAGKTVVRLKGGDPCVFGRCREEATALTRAGVHFEIVPGVTAAVAAAAHTGIFLTDRDYSSQVVFVTGHEAEGKGASRIDWAWLAGFGGTIVLYMAMAKLEAIVEQLIANRMPERTPVAIVSEATSARQKLLKGSLGEIAELVRREGIGSPAIVIIGQAAESDVRLNWFMSQPLFGKRLVVTRDGYGNAEFAAKIAARAGQAIEFATMKFVSLTSRNAFVQMLGCLSRFDWVIFTSRNGVKFFFESLCSIGKDARVLARAKVAAVGVRTAETLRRYGVVADFVPDVFTTRQLALQLARLGDLRGRKIALLRSELASDELAELLRRAGGEVTDVGVYTARALRQEPGWLVEQIRQGQVDWVTFASPFTARVFFEQIPAELVNESPVRIASIGPVTSEQLGTLGVKVDIEASEHTVDGLLDAIEQVYR